MWITLLLMINETFQDNYEKKMYASAGSVGSFSLI